LVRLRDQIEELKPELRSFRDERAPRRAPLPGDYSADARPRFLSEYDNLILSHADRTRVVPEEYRSSIFLSAGRVRTTFLVDGFVGGAWRTERTRGGSAAALVI